MWDIKTQKEDKMEDQIPKKNKQKSRQLVNQMIPLERPEKEDLEPSEYTNHILRMTILQKST